MNLPILNNGSSQDLQEFIKHWSKVYYYPKAQLYENNIHKEVYEANDIQDLFEWKNGMKLSEKKQYSLDYKIKAYLDIINDYKARVKFDKNEFLTTFSHLTAVWKIFLLHIIDPQTFPIYDQNIHRAFRFIQDRDFQNITSSSISNKQKEEFYFKEYLPFIKENKIQNIKRMDEAFFAFGQFLNTKNYRHLLRIL